MPRRPGRTRAGRRQASRPPRRACAGCAPRAVQDGRPRRPRGSRAPSRPGPGRARSRSRRAPRRSRAPSPARHRWPSRHQRRGRPERRRPRRSRRCCTVSRIPIRTRSATQRHDRGAADGLQTGCQHRVVGRIGQDREAVGDELLGRGEKLRRVGQQRAFVTDDLELDQVGRQRLAGQLRGEDRVTRRVTAGGVRQDLDATAVEHLDEHPRPRGRRGAGRP